MRISTSQIFDQNLAAMLQQQTKLAQTQLQVSTGKRILNPSDDPAGSVQLLNLQREASLSTQYLANADNATGKLENEEAVLASATDLLQRVRELAVQGLNGTNTPADRKAIAAEIGQLNQQLLALANTRDSNGDYLFAGFASNTQPYETLFGDYRGDEGQRNLKIGPGVFVPTNDPASSVFEAPLVATTLTADAANTGTGTVSISDNSGVPDSFPALTLSYNAGQYTVSDGQGNSASFDYTAGMRVNLGELDPAFPSLEITLDGAPADGDEFGIEKRVTETAQPLFRTLQNFANALAADEVGANDSPNNSDVLINLSAAMNRIVDKQAELGGRMNAIDQQIEINESVAFNLEKNISELRDLDYAEAISRLTLQSTSLQAAQQSFARVQGLSLFNYL